MTRRPGGDGWAIAFIGSRILLTQDAEGPRLPTEAELVAALGRSCLRAAVVPVELRSGGGRRTRVYGLDDAWDPPAGFVLEGLRVAYHRLTEEQFRLAGTARQKVQWHRDHACCGRCGARTERHPSHEAMACTRCGHLHFPRVAPAVIVLVQRAGEALLARSARFAPGVYSTLAGFVEPGESLEECVHREIEEEVGVTVRNLRYFGSQPHPFPHSLMIGFVADWCSGEIRIDPREIEDARWFTPDALPELPHPMSIARALIEDFVRRTSG